MVAGCFVSSSDMSGISGGLQNKGLLQLGQVGPLAHPSPRKLGGLVVLLLIIILILIITITIRIIIQNLIVLNAIFLMMIIMLGQA